MASRAQSRSNSSRKGNYGKVNENEPVVPDLIASIAMSWQSYVIPVVVSTTLMVACWSVGHFGFSMLWIVAFAALYVLKTHMWIRREQKRMRIRSMILRERDSIIAQFGGKLDDLPAWVQFPDTERIEWVNKILQQLWPYIGEYAKQFVFEFVEPQVRAQMPRPFKSFKFVEIDCGDMPCRVGGLKVYTENVGRDKIIVDMDVVYAGDAQFSVKMCGFQGGINQVVLSGKVRCVLQPLLAHPPMIGGISGSFIEMPKFDFNLTGMGEFVQLPGLIDAIRSVVTAQTANLCVLPNKIVVPLAPDVNVTKLYFPEPDGVIRLKVIEARNLENKDVSFIMRKDKSDPYCEILVGSQMFKTRTINNDLNPVFNECFEAVVDQASGQMLRIEMFDEDTASTDEELGRLSIPLDVVQDGGEIDKWYHLEGCKHGELHLKVNWLDLSTNIEDIERDAWESEWLTADKPMHPALLMIFVDSVSDLPYPKSNLEPSPFIEVTLGRISQRTPVKVKTINPLFRTKFTFFVKQPEGQELTLKAFDDGTRRELGELRVPLIGLLRQPNMEVFQQTFSLTHGIHASRIVLTMRLRTFTPASKNFDVPSDYTNYGTGSHIERAERHNNNTQELNRNSDFYSDPNNNSKAPNNTNNNIASSTEPGKTVEKHPNSNLTPESQLNVENFPSLKRSTSSSQNSAATTTTNGSVRSLASGSKKSGKSASNVFKRFKQQVGGARMHREVSKSALRGEIQVSVRYDEQHFKLRIFINSARGLTPLEKDGHADPYVQLKLVPLDTTIKPKGKRHTDPIPNTLNPDFNKELDFDMHSTELPRYKLLLIVKDAINYGMLSKPPILGQAEISLSDFETIADRWLTLEPPISKHHTASYRA